MKTNIWFSFAEITDSWKTSKIQILRTWNWKHPVYGALKISENDLEQFKENFDNKTRGVDLAVDINHDMGHRAVGWYKEVIKEWEKLFAVIEWTKEGVELIKTGVYRYFSPELHFIFQDEETGKQIKNVLVWGWITNRPFFKNMEALKMHEVENKNKDIYFYNTDKMNFKDIAAKLQDKENISAEEFNEATVAFEELNYEETVANMETMTNLQAKFNEEEKEEEEKETPEVEAETEETPDETPEEEEKEEEADEKEEEADPSEEKKEFSESQEFSEMLKAQTGMSLDEIKDQQKKFSEMSRQFKEKEISEKLGTFMFNDSTKEWFILPKCKDKLTAFVSKLNDNMAKEFFEILPNMNAKVQFGEMGAEGKTASAFNIPETTPAGFDRESFVIATVADQLQEKDGLEYSEAIIKAGQIVEKQNLK